MHLSKVTILTTTNLINKETKFDKHVTTYKLLQCTLAIMYLHYTVHTACILLHPHIHFLANDFTR